jgi:transcriptional regulator with XRE-family HTH domain
MFGETIRNNRYKNNMSQQELADASGTTRANIAKIESGVYLPSMYLALRLLESLNLTVNAQFLRRLIYGHDRKQFVN